MSATRLAELKMKIKEMPKEAKEIEKGLIESGADTKIVTEYGTLTLTTRVNMECPDKKSVFNLIGTDNFVAAATLSASNVKKQVGEGLYQTLTGNGLFIEGSVSTYYTLR